MLRPQPKNSSFTVHVKDHALVFFLPQPEQQSLWRFDLDSLIEQAFRLTGRDGYYYLTLEDLDGNSKVIARFVDKNQAQDVLDSLHDALIGDAGDSTCKTKRCSKWFGWLTFWRAVFLIIVGTLVVMSLLPAKSRPLPMMSPTADSAAKPAPSGVPLDADQLLE
ncbi:MAG TPA: hypothetical protein VGF14_02075 [Alphaproteobacteria bacterium]